MIVALFFLLTSLRGNAENQDASPIIELVRDEVGLCLPQYSIRIYEDGLVVYRGWNYVAIEGEKTDRIPTEVVSLLKQSFEEANFLELRQLERNPKTGAIKYDCNEVRSRGIEYPVLARECQNKEAIEFHSRSRGPAHVDGTKLGYRQGDKVKQLRISDVHLPPRSLYPLAKQIEDAVKAEKWTRPSPC